jgi:hypothetical protein
MTPSAVARTFVLYLERGERSNTLKNLTHQEAVLGRSGSNIQFRRGNVSSREASVRCPAADEQQKDADKHGKNVATIGT